MTTVLSTSGMLPQSQRLRLLRSIRKLGDLMTESSNLIDTPPPKHSRSASVSSPTLPPTSPVENVSEPTPSSRNFFSLRLAKTPAVVSSPLSPTFNLALISPATPVVDPETLKERKLAKVSQTLGHDVPPELVFPPAPRKGRNRSSTVSVPEYSAAQKATTLAGGAAVARRRRHARDASRTVRHAASSASLHADAFDPALEPFSYASLVPVTAISSEPQLENPTTPLGAAGMHRKEAGWSGEWSGSVRSMNDVVRGLRDLRLK
ncbi:hypothetical protein C8R46DRAFT_1359361 [Mycena filopes]|nr:hypothetical protein C8R46DRAFT_1359361 [Mycena filopes]